MKARLLSGTAMLAVASLAALLFVAGASAATVRVGITGSVQTTAVPSGDPSIGISLTGVDGDLTYTGIGTSTGTVTETFPSAPIFSPGMSGPGSTLTVFHGDVSQGCVRIQGNRAIVIGHLPLTEQFNLAIPGSPHYEWVGAFLEDNGIPVATPVDRAASVFFRTGMTACDASNTGIWTVVSNNLTALDGGDSGLAYTDQLDGYPANLDSDLTVLDPNGLSVGVADAPDPDGLRVTTGPGTGPATITACGLSVEVAASGEYVATCGSLILDVLTGAAEVVLDDLTSVSIPAGGKAEIADTGNGNFTVDNLGTVDITVTVDGVEGTVEPGETSTLEAWDFQGFFQPVDAMPMKNVVKASVAVPLKWRVLDTTGSPVTDLASAAVSVSPLDCTGGEGSDQVEQTTTNGSGLQNLGNGYYQLNWKTQKSYAGTCRTLHLDIGDGVTHDAYFSFTR